MVIKPRMEFSTSSINVIIFVLYITKKLDILHLNCHKSREVVELLCVPGVVNILSLMICLQSWHRGLLHVTLPSWIIVRLAKIWHMSTKMILSLEKDLFLRWQVEQVKLPSEILLRVTIAGWAPTVWWIFMWGLEHLWFY